MLIDRTTWAQHRRWCAGTAAAAAAAAIWYFLWSKDLPFWPGGASLPGFALGVAGGLIIAFEMLLWWRKQVRTWRIGRAQAWMRAHIWLGLLSVPLLVLHSGFRMGGALSTVLMVLFLLVIVSGIWGLAMQQFLPRRMLIEVPAETICSQIDHVSAELCKEAERMVDITCGPDESAEGHAAEEPSEAPAHVNVASLQSAGLIQGRALLTRVPASAVPDSGLLREFFHESIKPFLREGSAVEPLLRDPHQAEVVFRDLKTKLPPPTYEVVDWLAELCEQRRQLDHQARLHFWLHNWLWVHLPLSAAMFLLMLVHIGVAVTYW